VYVTRLTLDYKIRRCEMDKTELISSLRRVLAAIEKEDESRKCPVCGEDMGGCLHACRACWTKKKEYERWLITLVEVAPSAAETMRELKGVL
jgi:hypothetical protein